jgi:hypothetical protein
MDCLIDVILNSLNVEFYSSLPFGNLDNGDFEVQQEQTAIFPIWELPHFCVDF